MESILWLVGLAAFAFVMMRYGCGAHMMHARGGHGGHDEHGGHGGHGGPGRADATRSSPAGAATMEMRDPVCGMTVDPASGYARMYEGREYRFCSRQCLDQFDRDPQRILRRARLGPKSA